MQKPLNQEEKDRLATLRKKLSKVGIHTIEDAMKCALNDENVSQNLSSDPDLKRDFANSAELLFEFATLLERENLKDLYETTDSRRKRASQSHSY